MVANAAEFGTTFVDTVLMERAKLASYLMQCPFRLTSPPRRRRQPPQRTTRKEQSVFRFFWIRFRVGLHDGIKVRIITRQYQLRVIFTHLKLTIAYSHSILITQSLDHSITPSPHHSTTLPVL